MMTDEATRQMIVSLSEALFVTSLLAIVIVLLLYVGTSFFVRVLIHLRRHYDTPSSGHRTANGKEPQTALEKAIDEAVERRYAELAKR